MPVRDLEQILNSILPQSDIISQLISSLNGSGLRERQTLEALSSLGEGGGVGQLVPRKTFGAQRSSRQKLFDNLQQQLSDTLANVGGGGSGLQQPQSPSTPSGPSSPTFGGGASTGAPPSGGSAFTSPPSGGGGASSGGGTSTPQIGGGLPSFTGGFSGGASTPQKSGNQNFNPLVDGFDRSGDAPGVNQAFIQALLGANRPSFLR